MSTLSFRLPTSRTEAVAHRNPAPHRTAGAGRGELRRVMNAEDAARIALRRLGAQAKAREAASDDGESFSGSGWFDSTWELAKGLEICEVAVGELPLDGWLQLYLARDPLLGELSAAATAVA
ncbi:hypothetical protein [Piscinibacter sakaiensis]|uniref:hypothetical protein n=1 Tax=Piscinibacter sakaiensis TaxID=1547922 RepID=UPI003AAA4458